MCKKGSLLKGLLQLMTVNLPQKNWFGLVMSKSWVNFLKRIKFTKLFYSPNNKMENWISTVSDLGAKFGCRILVYNNLCGFFESRLVFVEESGRQFFSLQNEPLESPFNKMVKRIFDLIICVPTLIFLFPLFMVVVKIFQSFQSLGPLFFTQRELAWVDYHLKFINSVPWFTMSKE